MLKKKLIIKEQLDLLKNLLDYKLPNDENIRRPYETMYDKALAFYNEGDYVKAGEALDIEWSEE